MRELTESERLEALYRRGEFKRINAIRQELLNKLDIERTKLFFANQRIVKLEKELAESTNSSDERVTHISGNP